MLLTRPLRLLLRRRPSLVSNFHYTTPVLVKVLHKFKLADIGEGITECEVIKWSVLQLRPELGRRLFVFFSTVFIFESGISTD
jgi:2-oxoisovalerate dehydrogenase E2 component (dihydrolipoyl transacylase)